jgi:hypothetical protein
MVGGLQSWFLLRSATRGDELSAHRCAERECLGREISPRSSSSSSWIGTVCESVLAGRRRLAGIRSIQFQQLVRLTAHGWLLGWDCVGSGSLGEQQGGRCRSTSWPGPPGKDTGSSARSRQVEAALLRCAGCSHGRARRAPSAGARHDQPEPVEFERDIQGIGRDLSQDRVAPSSDVGHNRPDDDVAVWAEPRACARRPSWCAISTRTAPDASSSLIRASCGERVRTRARKDRSRRPVVTSRRGVPSSVSRSS